MADIHIAQIDYAINLLNKLNIFLRKAISMQTYGVKSYIRDRFARRLNKWRYVFIYQCSALKHDISAKMAELMHKAATSNDGIVVNNNLSGKLSCI